MLGKIGWVLLVLVLCSVAAAAGGFYGVFEERREVCQKAHAACLTLKTTDFSVATRCAIAQAAIAMQTESKHVQCAQALEAIEADQR